MTSKGQSGKHKCAYCGQGFSRISDHMIHVVESHPPSAAEPLKRPMSCWRCAKPIYEDSSGVFACTCGFAFRPAESNI